MEYNKTQFSKAQDKKVLHKVRKQWVVISAALLMLLGGGAVATHVSAHADDTNTQSNHVNPIKNQINRNLTKTSAQSSQPTASSVAQKSTQPSQLNLKTIDQQANVLHDRIMANGVAQSARPQNHHVAANQSVAQGTVGALHQAPEVRVGSGNGAPNVTPDLKFSDGNGNSFDADNISGQSGSSASSKIQNAFKSNANGALNGTKLSNYNIIAGDNVNFSSNPITVYVARKQNYTYEAPVTVKLVTGGKEHYGEVDSDNNAKFVTLNVAVTGSGNAANNGHVIKGEGQAVLNSYLKNKLGGKYSVVNPNSDSFSDFTVNVNNNSYSWQGVNGHSRVSDAASDTNTSNGLSSGVNWDKTNKRPMIVVQPTASQGTITVNYVNEAGHTLNGSAWGQGNGTKGNNDRVSDGNGVNYCGDWIDVTNPSNGGVQLPYSDGSGNTKYTSVSGSKDYSLDSQHTKTRYEVTSDNQKITIPLTGKKFADGDSNADNGLNKVTVNLYVRNSKGQYVKKGTSNTSSTPVQYGGSITHYLGGQIGKYSRISPSLSWIQSALPSDNTGSTKYAPDATDKSDQIMFSDGNRNNGCTENLNNPTENYYFNQSMASTPAQKITVNYVNQRSHQVVGTGTITPPQGTVGDTINLSDTTSADNDGVTGVGMPEGYSLASNANSHYPIQPSSDGNATVNLNVVGDQVATNDGTGNYPLTIHFVKKYFKNTGSGYVSDTNNNTYGTDKNGQNSDSAIDVKPGASNDANHDAILGQVGGSDVTVSASQFLNDVKNVNSSRKVSDISSNDKVVPTGTTNATVAFNPVNGSSETEGLSVNGAKASTSNQTITFDYNVYENGNTNQGKTSHVYVHYVTPSDQHSDITTTYNSDGSVNKNQETTVSDEGHPSDSFASDNQKAEENDNWDSSDLGNVPEGYQFVKVLGTNPDYSTTKKGNTLSYHFNGWKGNNGKPNSDSVSKFGQSDQNEVIEVVPKVKGVTVNYYDQNQSVNGGQGKLVKTVKISGNYTDKGNQSNNAKGRLVSRYGSVIDPSKSNNQETTAGEVENYAFGGNDPTPNRAPGDAIKGLSIPSGYHITSENTQYAFNHPGTGSDTYNVMIAGNSRPQDAASDTATITLNEENPQGTVVEHHYTVQDKINGDVGDNYTIKASDFTPSDYTPNPAGQSVTGLITTNGITRKNITFNYKYSGSGSNVNGTALKPIYVIYKNRANGNQVYMNTINADKNDSANESVDVRTRSGFKVPQGWQLDPSNSYVTHFGTSVPSYIDLSVDPIPAPGQTYTDDFTIIQKLYPSDAKNDSQPMDVRFQTVPMTGKKGDPSQTISQSNYKLAGFNDVQSNMSTGDGSQSVSFGSDAINPTMTTFYYKAQNSNDPDAAAKPITVRYYYKGGQVGNSDVVNGYMDQNFSDITKQAGAGVPDPKNYQLVPGQRLNYTIGTTPQNVNLNLDKRITNPSPATFHLKFASDNGTNIPNIPNSDTFSVYDDNVPYNLIPAAFAPQGYVPDISKDQSTSGGELGLNGNNDLQLSDNNNQFDINGANHGQASNHTFSDTFYYKKATTPDPNLQPIFVTYVDKDNGQKVGYYYSDTDIAGDTVKPNDHLPTGYSDSGSNPSNWTLSFKPTAQHVTCFVTGKSESEPLTVYYDVVRHGSPSSSGDYTVNLSGKVGEYSNYTVSDAKRDLQSRSINVSSGYSSNSADQNVYFNPDGSITPNSAHFNFYQKSGVKNEEVVNVEYVTGDGSIVGDGDIIGSKDQTISDVTNTSKGGVALPGKYTVDPSAKKSYTFTDQPNQVDKVLVDNQNKATDNLTIHRVAISDTGKSYNLSNLQTTVSGSIGSTQLVQPSDYTPEGSDYLSDGRSKHNFQNYVADPDDAAQVNVLNYDHPNKSGLSPNAVTFYYRQSPTKDAAPMVVRYFNQDHTLVGSGQINGTGRYGDTIDVTEPGNYKHGINNNGISGVRIPQGYQLDTSAPNDSPNQRTTYTFNSKLHVINLNVIGSPVSDKVPVSIKKNGVASGQYQAEIKGHVGDTFTVEPNGHDATNHQSFIPTGYHEDPNDQDATVKVEPNGSLQINQGATSGQIVFNYLTNDTTADPISIIYLNQDGNQVGQTYTVSGRLGASTGDVTQDDPVPSGYKIESDQDTSYNFSNSPQTIYLHVQGNQDARPLQVERVMRNSDGNIVNEDTVNYTLPKSDNHVGDTDVITPSNSNIDPSNYHPTSDDLDQIVQVNSDGSLTPNKIVFNYVHGNVNDGVIMVHYINGAGQQVGRTKEFSGQIGSGLTNSDIARSDQLAAGYTNPNAGSNSTVANYTNVPQDVNVNVTGNSVSNVPFTIYTMLKHSNGTMSIGKTYHLTHNGQIGDNVHVSPFSEVNGSSLGSGNSIVPSGYHATASDADYNLKVNVNGQFSPVNNVTYVYKQSYAPKNINTVQINYGTGTPGSNWQKLDTVYDHGTSDSTFDLSPYTDDLPDNLSNDYYSSNVVYHGDPSQSGTASKSNRITNPGNWTRQYGKDGSNYVIDIQVHPTSNN